MKSHSETRRQFSGRLVEKVFSKKNLAMVLFCVVVAIYGYDRDPADATEPLVIDGTPQFDSLPKHTIRVGTFNIHGGKGLDGIVDLERTSRLLHDLDLIALQEIYTGSLGNRHDQAAVIGRKLDLATLFVPAERRWWRNAYGNGLLSRVSSTGFHRIPLVTTQHEKYRTALLFNVRHQGRIVHFLSVHLDKRKDGLQQLKAISDLFLSLSEPAVLLGDLNTRKDSHQLKQLLSDPSVTDFVCDGLKNCPEGKGVDWIIARGLRFVDFGSVINDASNHPLVWAEMELSAPSHKSHHNVSMVPSTLEGNHKPTTERR